MAHKAIGPILRQEIYYRDGCRCVYCGYILTLDEVTIDHIVPQVQIKINNILHEKGKLPKGRVLAYRDPANLVASCASCNQLKADKTLEQYRSYLEQRSRYSHLFYFERKGFGTWNMTAPKQWNKQVTP